ncbi:MAG: adenylate kinase [Bryobacteraceae bacterium]
MTEAKTVRTRLKAALVLFGPPGSGKGTQAKLLQSCLEVPHISTGDMLREHIQAGDAVGRRVEQMMRSGNLAPDELVNDLVRERIARPDSANGFILDGYPRTVQQAATMAGMLASRGLGHLVVHLKVDYNSLIARLTGRRQCALCGALYNLSSNPPAAPNLCDRDGAELTIRDDDRESVIRQRLEAYENQTRPLLNYFATNGHRFYEVDGNEKAPQAIVAEICRLIRNG